MAGWPLFVFPEFLAAVSNPADRRLQPNERFVFAED